MFPETDFKKLFDETQTTNLAKPDIKKRIQSSQTNRIAQRLGLENTDPIIRQTMRLRLENKKRNSEKEKAQKAKASSLSAQVNREGSGKVQRRAVKQYVEQIPKHLLPLPQAETRTAHYMSRSLERIFNKQ